MALRSLAFNMKVLPRRAPGSRVFATAPAPKPKDDTWDRFFAGFKNASKAIRKMYRKEKEIWARDKDIDVLMFTLAFNAGGGSYSLSSIESMRGEQ